MSNFIQIGDIIINKAQIVSVEFDPDHKDHDRRKVAKLTLETTAMTSGDYGSISREYWFMGQEALILWEQLQHYLAPTVIQIQA